MAELKRGWVVVAACALALGCSEPEPAPLTMPRDLKTEPEAITRSSLVLVRGWVDPGDQAELYVNAACTGNPVAREPANVLTVLGIEIQIPQNAKTDLFALARREGRTSECAGPVSIIHDSVAPAPPSLGLVDLVARAPPRVRVSGAAEPGAKALLFAADACAGSPVESAVDTNGHFSIEADITPNVVTRLSARAIDLAGNPSKCSPTLDYAHDGIPPAAPVLTDFWPPSPGQQTLITINGTAEPKAKVNLYRDEACTQFLTSAPVIAGPGGAFAIQVTVPRNTTTQIRASARDAADNESECSNALTYWHTDATTPVLGPSTPPSPSPVLGFSLELTGQNAGIIDLFESTDCSGASIHRGTFPANGKLVVSLTAAPNAARTFTARQSTAAGHASECSAPFTYLHDDIPPPAPVITGTDPKSPSYVASPVVEGNAEAGTQVHFFSSPSCAGAPVAATLSFQDGTFGHKVPVSPNNTTTLTARATDAAGHTSPCSNAITYVHDNVPPPNAVAVGTNPPSPGKTNVVEVFGLGIPGYTAHVFQDSCTNGTLRGTALIGPPAPNSQLLHGSFSVMITLTTQSTFLWVDVRDAAGNKSSCTSLGAYKYGTPGWREVVGLDAPGQEGGWPALALTSGAAIAQWGRPDGAGGTELVTSDYAGGTWSAPSVLGTAPLGLLAPPRMAVDAAGRTYAAWSVKAPGDMGEVLAAVRPPGQAWPAPTSFGVDLAEPVVAGGAAGEGLLVYRAQTSTVTSEIHARSFDGAGWSPSVRIDDGLRAVGPRAAITSSGQRVVLYLEWKTTAGGERELRTTNSTGAAWSASQLLSTSGNTVSFGSYQLSPTGLGRAVASWSQYESSSFVPYMSRFVPTGFGVRLRMDTTYSGAPALAANGSDRGAFVWTTTFTTLRWASFTATTPTATLHGNMHSAAKGTQARLGIAPNGKLVAVWIADDLRDTGHHGVWISDNPMTSTSSTWTKPQLLAGGLLPSDVAELVMDNNRTVVVFTRTDSTGAGTVHARVLD